MTTAGPTGPGGRHGWPVVLAVVVWSLVLVLGAVAVVGGAVSAITGSLGEIAGVLAGPLMGAAPPSPQTCGKAVGPFTVRGTRVLGADGRLFVSYGITVPDMQGPNWANFVTLDLQKIAAIADDWCANTVRLQLDQDNLIGPDGTTFNAAYLKAIEAEVAEAQSDQLVVVLNDSTEFAPDNASVFQRGPVPSTEIFWKDMTALYGKDPQVIFDLFNEPRMYHPGMSLAQKWRLWLNGGTFAGVFYPFGMAHLVTYVRDTLGARNLFWVEGPRYSLGFAGMAREHAVIHVSGVVYAMHHTIGAINPDVWYAEFGYIVATGIGPVVLGEWTNYEPAPQNSYAGAPGSCWPDASTMVPAFLQYLASRGIGLDAYQLQPGYLIRSYADMGDPTTLDPRTWSCLRNSEPQPDQGAGQMIMDWFIKHNG
jgi:Cellulase (glycosyl hydrolase family 5)